MKRSGTRFPILLQDLSYFLVQLIAWSADFFAKDAEYTKIIILVAIGYTLVLILYFLSKIIQRGCKLNLFFGKFGYRVSILTSCCWLIVYFNGNDIIHINLSLLFVYSWISEIYLSIGLALSATALDDSEEVLDSEEYRG